MARNTPNMILRVWNSLSDLFSHNELASNWDKLDDHDHTTGKGKPVAPGGLAANTVGTAQLIDGSVNAAKVGDGTLTNAEVSPSAAIAESKLNLASDAAVGVASRRTLGIGATQAAQGSVVATHQALTSTAHIIPLVSALPTSNLVNGMVIHYQTSAMAFLGIVWTFRYRSSSLYPWEYIGGSPWYEMKTAQSGVPNNYVNISSPPNTWQDTSDPGPSLTPPLLGEYSVQFGFLGKNSGSSSHLILMGLAQNGVSYAFDYAARTTANSAYSGTSIASFNIFYTGGGLHTRYLAGDMPGSPLVSMRWIQITPVRVSS